MLRVRFAPSPTGYLHIGSARTFIFNWLYARHNAGTMILRIDDTDVERNTQQSLDSIFEGLHWLDLAWDEFYRQSERLDLHARAAALELKMKPGQLFQPIRVAVCGRKNSPPLFETLVVLGRETSLTRIKEATAMLVL